MLDCCHGLRFHEVSAMLRVPPPRRPTIDHTRPLVSTLWAASPAATRASLLRDYLDWCWTERLAPVPARSHDVTRWTVALTERLSHSSVHQLLTLLADLHRMLGAADPCEPARALFRLHQRVAR